MTIQDHLSLEGITDDNLSIFKAIGVDYVAVMHPPPPKPGDRADIWKDVRKKVESHGMKFNNVGLRPAKEITLGKPGSDEHIEGWCTLIRNMGEAGVPTLCYNFRGIGNFRTERTIGRGGASYSTFDYDEFMKESARLPRSPHLRRKTPSESPPRPEPLGGAARILSTLNDFERMFKEVPSPVNTMLFCQGCVREMGEDVPTAIRRIGAQNKIAAVHFRNLRGTPDRFQEVFVDEGDVDMYQAMQTYREVGFEGPFMMDHTPSFPQENAQWAGRAFAVGYIRSMIQAVYR